MSYLLNLPCLPHGFADCVSGALNALSPDYAGYLARVDLLHSIFQDLLSRLISDGDYSADAVGEAFVRSNDEPGRAWNMDEWNKKHTQRIT